MTAPLRLSAYLARIGCGGALAPDRATLDALHAAHVAAIPFDALDPFCGRPVAIDLDSIQSKLVDSRRGGYCFEQNTLFKAVLEAIGFRVTALGGRVRWSAPPGSPLGPRLHMLLKVDLPEGAYLADVGFGACVLDTPLRLEAEIEQRTPMGTFRIEVRDGYHHLAARLPAGWRTMYAFDLAPQIPSDALLGNWYSSTHPAAIFTRNAVMERVDASVRHRMVNRRYLREAREGEIVAERAFDNAAEWGRCIEDAFGIVLPLPANEIFERVPRE